MIIIRVTLPSGKWFASHGTLDEVAGHYRGYVKHHPEEAPAQGFPLFDILEMTEAEYCNIPVTSESIDFFGLGDKSAPSNTPPFDNRPAK